MKTTEDVREFAAQQEVAEEQTFHAGMEQKAREFLEKGGKLYAKASRMISCDS